MPFENLLFYKTTGKAVLSYLIEILKIWWWVILPFILRKPFLFLWRSWRIEHWLSTVYKPILLEIKIPRESIKPIRAMEDVMASLHSVIYHPPDWWETWMDGQLQTSLSLEIASFGGAIHFFIRCEQSYRDSVEAAIYAQYPDAEISQADDYTKLVPQDMPNKDWDFWATDYTLLRKKSDKTGEPLSCYPILTYKKFEKEPEIIEEKRVDPVATLFEALSKVKPGQQFWVQIMIKPVTKDESKWIEEGIIERDRVAKREATEGSIKTKPMVLEAAEILLKGASEEEPQPKSEQIFPPEMKLTPGERDIVAAIEEKISKPGFATSIRFIYLGKKDVFFKPNLRLGFSFFGSFATQNLNSLIPWGKTITKIKKSRILPLNLLIPRRLYLRQRKIFRNYVNRDGPLHPRPGGDFVLNTEELATIFHFPSWRVAPVPGVARVEARRRAPPELPVEE